MRDGNVLQQQRTPPSSGSSRSLSQATVVEDLESVEVVDACHQYFESDIKAATDIKWASETNEPNTVDDEEFDREDESEEGIQTPAPRVSMEVRYHGLKFDIGDL